MYFTSANAVGIVVRLSFLRTNYFFKDELLSVSGRDDVRLHSVQRR
jgi:hypothetical protein